MDEDSGGRGMSTHKEYNEDYPETPEEIRAEYQSLMEELSDVLQGGDVAIDFEYAPRFSAVISIIHGIVKRELDTLRENEAMSAWMKVVLSEEEDKKTGLLHDLPFFDGAFFKEPNGMSPQQLTWNAWMKLKLSEEEE